MKSTRPEKDETRDGGSRAGFGVMTHPSKERTNAMNPTPTQPAAEADRRQEQTDDADFALHQAMHLADLMAYIERARHLCDAVSQFARISPSFRDELQAANIQYGYPDWTDNVSEGMAVLGSIQWRLIRGAREVMSPETKAGVH